MPDLICLRDNKIKFIEIKREGNRISKEQKRAIKLLNKHGFNAKVKTYHYVSESPEIIFDNEEVALYKSLTLKGFSIRGAINETLEYRKLWQKR